MYLWAIDLNLFSGTGRIWSGLGGGAWYIREVIKLFIEKCAEKKEWIINIIAMIAKSIFREGILRILATCGIIETSTCRTVSCVGVLLDIIQVVLVQRGYKVCVKAVGFYGNIAIAMLVFIRYTIFGLTWAIGAALVGLVIWKLGESTSYVLHLMLSNNNGGLPPPVGY